VYLCAPTGRAAIRMTEASGIRARTVHSALGWIPGQGPEHDEDDPLDCDLLIVDVEVGSVRRIDTDGVDVTRVRWRDGASLVYFGIRGFESVAASGDAGRCIK